MLYKNFEEQVLFLEYKDKKEFSIEWENVLSQDKKLWEKFILRSLIKDNLSENTEYTCKKFFGKQSGCDFFNSTIKKIKNEYEKSHPHLLFSMLLNNDLLTLSEKENLLNESHSFITKRHWQCFFYNMSYEGSKLLPLINENYNFQKYRDDLYLNRAFFNITNNIYQIPEEDNVNNEKSHIILMRKQAEIFFELLKSGLDPTSKVINEKLTYLEDLIYKKRWAFLIKLLSINEKNNCKLYFKNEAVFLVKKNMHKGINRDLLGKLIKNTKFGYLTNKDENNNANVAVIMEYIYYNLGYHKKNADLLLEILTAEEIKENLSPFKLGNGSSIVVALKENSDYKISNKYESKINLALAMIEKDILNKVFSESKEIIYSNKKRL